MFLTVCWGLAHGGFLLECCDLCPRTSFSLNKSRLFIKKDQGMRHWWLSHLRLVQQSLVSSLRSTFLLSLLNQADEHIKCDQVLQGTLGLRTVRLTGTAVNLQLKSQNGNRQVKNSRRRVVRLFAQPFDVYYFFHNFSFVFGYLVDEINMK